MDDDTPRAVLTHLPEELLAFILRVVVSDAVAVMRQDIRLKFPNRSTNALASCAKLVRLASVSREFRFRVFLDKSDGRVCTNQDVWCCLAPLDYFSRWTYEAVWRWHRSGMLSYTNIEGMPYVIGFGAGCVARR